MRERGGRKRDSSLLKALNTFIYFKKSFAIVVFKYILSIYEHLFLYDFTLK